MVPSQYLGTHSSPTNIAVLDLVLRLLISLLCLFVALKIAG